MKYHEIISNLRVKNGYTQEDIAKLLKISSTAYKYYETAERLIPLEKLNILANLYRVSLDYLLGLTKKNDIKNTQKNINYRYLKFCIRFLRKRERITQVFMADYFGSSSWMIWHYENDPYSISILYLIFLSKRYKISVDYMCGKSMKKEVLK